VVTALLTDNGGAYRSRAFGEACTTAGLTHRFTKPYRPRTNGKAQRFILSLLPALGLPLRLPVERPPRPCPLRRAPVVQQAQTS